jgi:hypothetical protein
MVSVGTVEAQILPTRGDTLFLGITEKTRYCFKTIHMTALTLIGIKVYRSDSDSCLGWRAVSVLRTRLMLS